jgi:transposase InsO family protein
VVPNAKEMRDRRDFELILEAYRYRRRNKGAKSIKMTLEGHFGVVMNLKKVRRLMKKYGLICPIRKANPNRRMMKALRTNSVFQNQLNREFVQTIPRKVFLTDITYLIYHQGERAYLSTVLDLATKEVVSHQTSETLEIPFVLDTIHLLVDETSIPFAKDAYIHSDQGAHYTSRKFQELVRESHLGQSMSRRGNCWDNAPQESFFGHLKDELDLEKCKSFAELKAEVDDFIDYYNNDRYQWGLAKMTPVQYRDFLLSGGKAKGQNSSKRKMAVLTDSHLKSITK